jgi:hypothetical protein
MRPAIDSTVRRKERYSLKEKWEKVMDWGIRKESEERKRHA